MTRRSMSLTKKGGTSSRAGYPSHDADLTLQLEISRYLSTPWLGWLSWICHIAGVHGVSEWCEVAAILSGPVSKIYRVHNWHGI